MFYTSILLLANLGIKIALDRFSIGKIRENLNNKKLIEYLDKHIQEVYDAHPNYQKCSETRFKKAGIFDYFLSEFRDKKKKDLAKQLGKEFIDLAIDFAAVPFLFSKLFGKLGIGVLKSPMGPISILTADQLRMVKYLISKPLKILASKFGVTLALGSIYEQAIEYKGTILMIGLDYSPTGFRFVNMRVLSVKEGDKLVQTSIKNPPAELFLPSKETYREIIKRIFTKSSKQIKEEIKREVKDFEK
jgi:hypothetical protein